MNAKEIAQKLRNAVRSDSRWIVVHSSLFHLGLRHEELQSFKWAFLQAVRSLAKDGFQLAFPAFTFSFTRTGIYHPQLRSEVGLLSDWVFDLLEAERTPHPIYSHVIVGDQSERLHACDIRTCFGDNSIYAFFEDNDATIIMLGCDWTYNTSFHRYEELFSVPYRYHKSFSSVDNTLVTSMYVRDEKLNVRNDFSKWISKIQGENTHHVDSFFEGKIQSIDFATFSMQCKKDLGSDIYSYTKDPQVVSYEVSCRKAMESSETINVALLYESNYEPLVAELEGTVSAVLPRTAVRVIANDYGQMVHDVLNDSISLNPIDYFFLPSRLEDILHVSSLEFSDLSSVAIVDHYIALIKKLSLQVKRLVFVNLFPVSFSSLSPVSINDQDSHVSQNIAHINEYLVKNLCNLPNVRLLPIEGMRLDRYLDSRLWHLGKIPYSPSGFSTLANHYAGLLAHELGFSTRLIILDLDNTLWGGVLGEDGIDGIQVGGDFPGNVFKSFQQLFLKLYERGIALAIVSKNDEDLALTAINSHHEMVLKDSHISAYRINWQEKVSNIQSIAEELGLSLNNVMFIDDNSLEREKVRKLLPAVNVIDLPVDPAGYADAVLLSPQLIASTLTSEDKKRASFYVSQRKARLATSSFDNLDDYFHSLNMRLTIAPVNDFSFSRTIQLIHKTNQFNTTTRRFSEAEVREMIRNESYSVVTVAYSDNVIEPEVIALCIFRNDEHTVFIELFLMSCRVLGRSIESAVLAWVEKRTSELGAKSLIGEIVMTERNTPARDLYERHGFSKDGSNQWVKNIVVENSVRGMEGVPQWINLSVTET